jgi:hypothetical protein
MYLKGGMILLLSFLLMPMAIANAQSSDSSGFEGVWGGFTPSGPDASADNVATLLVTRIAHSGEYSVCASAPDGKNSWMGKWYGDKSPFDAPIKMTIWVNIESQAGGDLELVQLWGFFKAGDPGYWLVALLRGSDGSFVIRGSSVIRSGYLISMNAWHKYSVLYDGHLLRFFVDDNFVLADTGHYPDQSGIRAVNLGVMDTAHSLSQYRDSNIGYGTAYFDDYSLESVVLVTETSTTSLAATTITVERIPSDFYLLVLGSLIGVVALTYALMRRKPAVTRVY